MVELLNTFNFKFVQILQTQLTALPSLIGAAFLFGLGVFVFLKQGKKEIGIIFTLVCFALALWLFATFMMYLGETDEQIIFWDRTVYAGVVFIPILMYHFGLIFTGLKKNKLLWLGYILAFVFFILSRTDYFASGLYRYSWGYHTQAKILHTVFLGFFFAYVLLFLFTLYKRYQKLSGTEREQAKYIFIAFLIINLGAVAYLPAYGIDFYPISAFVAEIVGAITIAYAIVKYRLMNIRLVVGKGAVYILSFASVILFASLLIYLNERWGRILSYNAAGVVIIVLSIVLFQSISRFFEGFASKYFYYTFYSYQKVLTDLGRRLTMVLDLENLASLILITLTNTLKLDKAILLLKKPDGRYEVQKNIGFKEENDVSLSKIGLMAEWMEENQKPLIYEEISLIARDLAKGEKKKRLEELKNSMKNSNAALCLPLLAENKILGIIVLGSKVSRDPYSQQDIDLLINLANQASIALQNAKLYDQVTDLSQNLQEKVDEQTKELKTAYEELKRLDKAKSEFLSIASHQLRTPLTAIRGYVSMVLEKTYGKVPEKMKKPLKNVYISNERLIKLVNDLLNVSRIEAGRIVMNFELSGVEEIISSVVKELEQVAKAKNIYLAFEKPEKSLPEANIDKDKLRQVVINIIDNAIHYTSTGGIKIKCEGKKGAQRIIISDTGEGMDKGEINSLFESFSRGGAGNKLWTEGAGLGLYIAKKFVDLHKGKIWAESKGRGKGSTFYIELPTG